MMNSAAAWLRFGVVCLVVGLGVLAVFLWMVVFVPQSTSADRIFLFEGVRGPGEKTVVAPPRPAADADFRGGGTSRLAILLTEPDSAWLGLVHGLKTIGVPFRITRDYQDALRHRVVLVYPTISGRVLSREALVALARFPEDGTAAITARQIGRGHAYALGVDLGFLLLKGYNNREQGIARAYVNEFEPALDVLLRLVANIYRAGEPAAVTLHTVPQGRQLAAVISHDVDFTRSVANAPRYAELERAAGVRATYFIQTKYVRDWNDDVFFNRRGVSDIAQLRALGAEIASHSVSHSRMFRDFAVGSGDESYPDYRPFVRDREHTVDGSILGEFPVTLEDEAKPPLETRLPAALKLADRLARYGALMMVLIHTDVLESKLGFERGLVAALRDRAWFGALEDFGAFWSARDRVELDVGADGAQLSVRLRAPEAVRGLAFVLPAGYRLTSTPPSGLTVREVEGRVVIEMLEGEKTLHLVRTGDAR